MDAWTGCDAFRGETGVIVGIAGIHKGFSTHPLTRKQLTRTWLRFLHWQLRARLAAGPLRVQWLQGLSVVVAHGEAGMTGNIYCGLLEYEHMAFVLHYLRPVDLFVDVGANSGAYSLLASGICRSRSVAFEPVPATFERLCRNLRINNLESLVDARPAGVGARSGRLAFSSGEDSMNHVDTSASGSSTHIEVVDLDHAIVPPRDGSVVLKIDVEGYEGFVLAGAKSLLADTGTTAVVLEMNGSGSSYGFSNLDLHGTMVAHGFQAYSYNPDTRLLESMAVEEERSGNVLYARDPVAVQARTRSANAFLVLGSSH
jgi:FkbM family methyltransferase